MNEIADAAISEFSSSGFGSVQVASVAKRAGISTGTIYLYVEDKESLFFLALGRTLGRDYSVNPPTNLVLSPESLRDFLEDDQSTPYLSNAFSEVGPLNVVLGLLWDELSRLGPTIKLIERCAGDWPELAQVFYENSRTLFLSRIEAYLRAATERGIVRRLDFYPISARLILETMAWFTIHRLGDYDGRTIPNLDAKSVTVESLFFAFKSPELNV